MIILNTKNPFHIIHADVLIGLAQIPDESIHCIITSPPYFNLRDYGIPGQIGLEETFDEWLSKMVEVFREVRRVLRSDGTLWLNLGSSYASGGMNPNRSRPSKHAPAYGNDDKESRYFQDGDRVCPDSYDEHQAEIPNHHDRNSHNDQYALPGEQPTSQINHDNEHSDFDRVSFDSSLLGAQKSTILSSPDCDQGACAPSTKASVCPSKFHSSACDAPPSSRKTACISDIEKPLGASAHHRSDISFSDSASDNSFRKEPIALTSLYYTISRLKFKPKDLIMQPHILALALQADGWYLRSDIIFAKSNPMPEGVIDRPAKSHEHIFLLTKAAKYFYDAEAVKEKYSKWTTWEPYKVKNQKDVAGTKAQAPGDIKANIRRLGPNPAGRNLRDVWSMPTTALRIAHFASFPPAIPEKCIKAGTSEKGCCPACGTPWLRILEKTGGTLGQAWHDYDENRLEKGQYIAKEIHKKMKDGTYQCKTIGWKPYCDCNAGDPVPAIVLDPFSGAGTTVMVALRLGRFGLGIEINEEYVEKSIQRITRDQEARQLNLF